MSAAEILAALDLPDAARVDRRVPKTLLVEHGAPTAADRRQVNEGVEELFWVAALKPTTIGVPAFRDDLREYLEIAVVRLHLRADAKTGRLVELVHRAVPYPVLLVAEQGERTNLSLAHKRRSQGEAGKTVLDGEVVNADCDDAGDAPHAAAFRDALALHRQPRGTLYALYQGWLDTLLTLQAAWRTGSFATPDSAAHAAARRAALQDCSRLDMKAAGLRTAAAREKQLARQVELNLELKRVEAAQAIARAQL